MDRLVSIFVLFFVFLGGGVGLYSLDEIFFLLVEMSGYVLLL